MIKLILLIKLMVLDKIDTTEKIDSTDTTYKDYLIKMVLLIILATRASQRGQKSNIQMIKNPPQLKRDRNFSIAYYFVRYILSSNVLIYDNLNYNTGFLVIIFPWS